jgi:hypothetical protein
MWNHFNEDARDVDPRSFGGDSTPWGETIDITVAVPTSEGTCPGCFDCGGEGGIRTHEALADPPVFKTGAINRSATSPR